MDEIIQVSGRFYTKPYASDVRPGELLSDVPLVTEEEVEKPLKSMKRGKSAGDDGIKGDLLKQGGDID